MDRNLTHDIAEWVHAMCHAPSAEPAHIASALGIDLARARRVGSQLICLPPAGADRFQMALDRATQLVSFAEARLDQCPPLEGFAALFGPARKAPPGPHEAAPTMTFDRVWPTGALRSCAVLAQLAAVWPGGREDLVGSVVLYLHPSPAQSDRPG